MAEQGPSGNKLQSTVDVRSKREQVLSRYSEFKNTARLRRERLEAARHFQQFRRDADELEAWINEKIQIVSDESYKERTNLQVLMPVPDGNHGVQLGGGGAEQRFTLQRTQRQTYPIALVCTLSVPAGQDPEAPGL